jgi:hypothetical protein
MHDQNVVTSVSQTRLQFLRICTYALYRLLLPHEWTKVNVLSNFVRFSKTDGHVELAKEGVPLPFGNRFWASNWPTGKSPLPGLIIHLIPSVSMKLLACFWAIFRRCIIVQVIVIIAPPPSVVYPFILDVEGYPQQIINLFIVLVRRTFLLLVTCCGPWVLSVFVGSFLVEMEETWCCKAVQRSAPKSTMTYLTYLSSL